MKKDYKNFDVKFAKVLPLMPLKLELAPIEDNRELLSKRYGKHISLFLGSELILILEKMLYDLKGERELLLCELAKTWDRSGWVFKWFRSIFGWCSLTYCLVNGASPVFASETLHDTSWAEAANALKSNGLVLVTIEDGFHIRVRLLEFMIKELKAKYNIV